MRDVGLDPERALSRAIEATRAWSTMIVEAIKERLPSSELVLFFDEPALVSWRAGKEAIERERAIDVLSGVLAFPGCITGVHVCGVGDVRLALDAGPDVLGIDMAAIRPDDAVALARFLDGDGWIAWGAVPTDRPVGDHVAPLWKALTDVWRELAQRGCDPERLRHQAMVTPACGLSGHGESQAERALRLAHELGVRVRTHEKEYVH